MLWLVPRQKMEWFSRKDLIMNFKHLLIATTLATACAAGWAQSSQGPGYSDTGISYNEVGVGLGSAQVKLAGQKYTFNGAGIGGSVLVGRNFVLGGTYTEVSKTIAGSEVRSADTNLSLGYRVGIGANVDLVPAITALNNTSKVGSTSNTSQGYAAGISLRAALSPNWDASFGVSHVKYDGLSADTATSVGVGYHLSRDLVLRGELNHVKDQDTALVSLSYKF